MSESPSLINNRRKSDPNSPGQTVLLICAVAAAVVFASLYITGRRNPSESSAALLPPVPASVVSANPVSAPLPSHEPTKIEVEQVLLVAPADGAPAEKIVVRTPAVYPTGTLQWTPGQVDHARALQTRLANVLRHQAAIERELERIESEWQQLTVEGLPLSVLFADSPGLPRSAPSPTKPSEP